MAGSSRRTDPAKGVFPPPSFVEPDAQKNTPANREKCRGVLWVGLQTMAIRPRFQPESKLFSGKPGNLQDAGRIFGDMRAVSADMKIPGIGRNFANRA